ncbi:MAG TPA: hypothetical protein VHD87_16810 [Acidimicrobiales bacterium]|nr:hypothetical protein [Acidimicrobiales bacterium]
MQPISATPSSRVATVMIAVAILLALVGIGGVAFGAADKPSTKASATGSTTSTSELSASDTTLPGATETTAAGAGGGATSTTIASGNHSTATTAAGAKPSGICGDAPATATDPTANQAPAIGRYTFVDCSDNSKTVDEAVTAGASSNGVTRRNVTADMGGQQQTSSIAYGPNGVLIESLSFDSPQGRLTCDLNPDVLNYPADIHVGSQWSGSSTCDIKNNAGVKYGTIKLDSTGKVTGKVAATVGTTTVNAWSVEGTITLTATVPSFGSQTTHINERGYYDPAHGIEVYRHAEVSNGANNVTTDEKLSSLTPKAS